MWGYIYIFLYIYTSKMDEKNGQITVEIQMHLKVFKQQ